VFAGCLVAGRSAGAYTHTRFPHVTQPAVWTMGYYAAYERDLMPVGSIPWTDLTHIAFGPVVPRADGTIDRSMFLGPGAPAFAKQVTTAAKNNNVQPILMVGGAGAHRGFAAAMKNHRAAFITNLFKAMDQMGFTGVDLDLEPVSAGDRAPLVALARGLRRRDPNVTVTFPAGPETTTFPEQDTVDFYAHSLAPVVDHIALMTYDMSGAYDGWDSWHFAPLYGESTPADCANPCHPTSVDWSVRQFIAAGIPASELSIGVGFYGACWTPQTGPGQPLDAGDEVASDNDMSYANIEAGYASRMTYSYDTGAEQAELSSDTPVGGKNCTWISYEDPRSVTAKGAYIKAQGLGGAIIWTIPEGRTGVTDPLLAALHAALS